ncbi:hypothetical protein SAMN05444279_11425 [Ruegeria intermedia]|uniref:Uncharacterized protein n=1 Tax=Ruegeria intermedia TaxID=996115 RepID=A0A1M4Y6C7_9RHOB|nr:hypothetical protein SAMN05444279_11425 [Ruegeria intermedia]
MGERNAETTEQRCHNAQKRASQPEKSAHCLLLRLSIVIQKKVGMKPRGFLCPN